MKRSTTLIATIVTALVAASPAVAKPIDPLALPSGSTPVQDLRSPDARGDQASTTVLATDLRSPDARGDQPSPTVLATDMRTPDAVDGTGTSGAPDVIVVESPAPAGSGIEWQDAGLGAGILAGLVLLAAGGGVAVSRHRHAGRTVATS